ncbi:MAG: hypothetical protein FGF51_07580 [Candidatus Brockarchaeota archaeon]|nr:hypothetical protein [Candidatus Brockarchaeota archaeon]
MGNLTLKEQRIVELNNMVERLQAVLLILISNITIKKLFSYSMRNFQRMV